MLDNAQRLLGAYSKFEEKISPDRKVLFGKIGAASILGMIVSPFNTTTLRLRILQWRFDRSINRYQSQLRSEIPGSSFLSQESVTRQTLLDHARWTVQNEQDTIAFQNAMAKDMGPK